MIYGAILEEYTVPKIVRINVTVLRGARRMRFSSKLRATYEDFAPILWETLAHFGYRKYLQRIYISVEHSSGIKAKELELPILLETMRVLKLAYIAKDVLAAGYILPSQKIRTSKIELSKVFSPLNLYTLEIKPADRVTQALKSCVSKNLDDTSNFKRDWGYILKLLFPGTLITEENRLDLTNTSTSILRKISIKEFQKIPCTLDLNIKQRSSIKLEFIKSLPLRDIHIHKASCQCLLKACECSKKQLAEYKKRNGILKINAWRNVVPF